MSIKNDQINLSPPRIVCAANKLIGDDGHGNRETFMIAGARHHDKIMNPLIKEIDLRRGPLTIVQGFIDQHGQFYTRKQAWDIAEANGQIIRRCGGDGADAHGLFSENLY